MLDADPRYLEQELKNILCTHTPPTNWFNSLAFYQIFWLLESVIVVRTNKPNELT